MRSARRTTNAAIKPVPLQSAADVGFNHVDFHPGYSPESTTQKVDNAGLGACKPLSDGHTPSARTGQLPAPGICPVQPAAGRCLIKNLI